MTGAEAIRLTAPAKLNLYLHVIGRRPDGYHLLDSLVVFTGLADELEISPAKRLSLEVEGPFAAQAGPDSDNLVLRAAEALARAAGVTAAAAIRLIKNIPVKAGLGGGSADAAAALAGLAQFWRIAPGAVDLLRLALDIGADIPVCLAGSPSFVGGVGERIDPAPALPRVGLLLVNPGVGLATPTVFAARSGAFSKPDRFSRSPVSAGDLAESLAARRNDLTDAAIGLAPAVGEVLARIRALPGCRLARMTGSGATCFGLFDDAAAAADAARLITQPGWWIAATGLKRAEKA